MQDIASLPFRKPDEASEETRYLQREARGARRLPAAAPAHRPGAGDPAARGLRLDARGHRRARDLHHHGVRAHADRAAQGQEHRQATSCRSCRTRRAPSAWRACSARSASTPRSVSCTRRRTPRPSCPTARTRRARCSRRASTRPARCARGSPPVPPTAITASTWCRSTSSIRCSVSSGSGTSSGRPATSRRAASCSAPPRGARRSPARACSTRTVTVSWSRRTVPNCVAYDPAYAYELAVIIHDGMRRMYAEQESIFYYITVMNENYVQPAMPAGRRGGDPAAAVTRCTSGGTRQGARHAAGLRHDPARVSGGGEDSRGRLQDSRGRALDHLLQRAAPRGARVRALEPAASGRERARAVRERAAEGPRRAG